jgi:VCBS repeat-containing protein
MSNEHYEKRMEFIVEHQAQFSIDIQQLRESQAELQAAQVRTEQVVVQSGEIVARLANVTLEGFKDVNAKIDALVDSQIRTDEKINALTDNIQNLTAIVNRYFTEGRDGNNLGG